MKTVLVAALTCAAGISCPASAKGQEWAIPETKIPVEYWDTARGFFGKVIADPRGGKYCKVRIPSRSATAHDQDVEVYGWVLPHGKQQAARVVLWDGVEYPWCTVLAEADLAESLKSGSPGWTFWQSCWSPGQSPAAPVLLLLLGRAEDAANAYSQFSHDSGAVAAMRLRDAMADRYKMLAADALKLGRYEEGVDWADRLVLVEKTSIPLSETERRHYGESARDWQGDELSRDLQRRVVNRSPSEPDVSTLVGLTPDEQVKVLIQALDQVKVDQFMQPGGVSLSWSPIVRALTKLGDRAVPALIDCIESDDRLTRSVSYGRDFFPGRTVLTVRSAAMSALVQIWPAAAMRWKGSHIETAAALREAWIKDKSRTEPERQLAVLEDNSLGPRAWLSAAEFLVRSVDVNVSDGWVSSTTNPSPTMRGEPLRKQGRLTSLFLKRFAQMVKALDEDPRKSMFFETDLTTMALCIFKWDRNMSLQALSTAQDISLSRSNARFGIGALVSARLALKDSTALVGYRRFLRHTDLLNSLDAALLRPMVKDRNVPGVEELAQEHFADVLAKITSATDENAVYNVNVLAQVSTSRVFDVPAFRTMVVKWMASQRSAARAVLTQVGEDATARLTFGDSRTMDVDVDSTSLGALGMGTACDVTVGDLVALSLARVEGAPRFSLFWSTEEKSAGKKRLTAWFLSTKQISNPFRDFDPFDAYFRR
ncbi:MAG: hypothetical protein JST30_00465 [Armatimonadetes bacterium]|nr:hypothetical protein [Armatimonadota bacterium]